MFVVTAFRLAQRGGAAPEPGGGPPRPPPPPPPPRAPPLSSQLATVYPCSVFSVGAGVVVTKCSNRVCVPASISIFRVLSSAQVICSLPGTRRLPPAAYALQGSEGSG